MNIHIKILAYITLFQCPLNFLFGNSYLQKVGPKEVEFFYPEKEVDRKILIQAPKGKDNTHEFKSEKEREEYFKMADKKLIKYESYVRPEDKKNETSDKNSEMKNENKSNTKTNESNQNFKTIDGNSIIKSLEDILKTQIIKEEVKNVIR